MMRFVPRAQVFAALLCLSMPLALSGQENRPKESDTTAAEAKAGQAQRDAAKEQKPENDILPAEKKPMGPPSTRTLPQPEEVVAADSLLKPPPAPKGKVSLIGGTVKKIDQIRNRMEVSIFGGGKMKMFFDERSHFFRDGVESTQLIVKKGDRVYVDSQLDNGKIFARNVHVDSGRPMAAASGQVVAYSPGSGELTLNEPISARPLYFRITKDTTFRRGDEPGLVADLRNNAIVNVRFVPSAGKRSEIKEVELVAVPGTKFTFYGRLSHIDLRSGLLAVDNKSDGRLYEVHFKPSPQTVTDDLVIGAQVSIVAVFTGKDYAAQSIQITRTAQGAADEMK